MEKRNGREYTKSDTFLSVVMTDKVSGPRNSRMSICRKIMIGLYDLASFIEILGDYLLLVFPPFSSYLFEIISVDPRFQGGLVLFWGFFRNVRDGVTTFDEH